MNEFTVNTKLPSLNEYINTCRANRYKGAALKRETETVISWEIKSALAKKSLKPTCKPCNVMFEWHERTYKRDCDNIASAKKYILDAMQKCEIIPNDSQKYIKGFTDVFIKDDRDFVKVTLYEQDL